ncbi:MAG: hypothetical protein LBE33_08575, partial [Zoogloeaceae bacterium]|nr:hypothetical protein [Zoogloeaceae bacterium]
MSHQALPRALWPWWRAGHARSPGGPHGGARFTTDKRKLTAWLAVLLGAGFIVIALVSYVVARDSIRGTIITNELPLTSNNVYLELQKDLLRPFVISSM